MFEVCEGKDGDALKRRRLYEMLALITGRATKIIFLNGGSETRKEAREYWAEQAALLGVPYSCTGNCIVMIGRRG